MNLSNPEQPTGTPNREYFRFSGKGGEYFRIWIVNLTLTVLTLGIYSAWAKVRRNRYIYGSTSVTGGHFDYHATPVQILRGRLLAMVLFLVFLMAPAVLPGAEAVLAVLLFLLTPWLIVRSKMFNLRYTSCRNIRFSFQPAYAEAVKVFLGLILLLPFTLGLIIPYAHYRRNAFMVNGTSYGTLKLQLADINGRVYLNYLYGLLLLFFLGLGVAVVSGGMLALSGAAETEAEIPDLASALPVILMIVLYYVIFQFVNALVLRDTVNSTTIGEHQLGCDWSPGKMLLIYLTNVVAIALSLGLLIPWAQMRISRYQLNHTYVDVRGTIDDVIAAQASDVSSIGEEIGDIFDIDVGL
ncbi:MAG: YjgN family protein [Gammaproteobacteria bacterium]